MLKTKKVECTGCSACYSACPFDCISMIADSEGFLYPQISGNCVKCGKCTLACPVTNDNMQKPVFDQHAFCVLTNSKKTWKRSASGGAFSEICNAYADDNTLILGAAWNGTEVEHIAVRGPKEISPLCKSKYIASSINDSFRIIKQALVNEEKVIFCGTPCQVAGLKTFLGKEYKSLLLIDLICHGVGSPSVFSDCIKVSEKDFNARIVGYEFRAKRITYETPYLVKLSLDNGKSKYVVEDRYMQLFLNQNCLRESCGENCIYRTQYRQGDLTIADCKGLQEIFPELIGTNFNYSTVITNTEKGQLIIEHMKSCAEVRECTIESVKKYNPLFYRQSDKKANRESFFYDYLTLGAEAAILKHTKKAVVKKQNKKQIVVRTLIPLLPYGIKNWLVKLVKSNEG